MPQISAIWVGNPFFYSALPDLGWRVHYTNPEPGTMHTWETLVADAGFTPDIVIVADKSIPPFVVGMEKFPCLTTFYAVDTHVHSWFPHYAQGFDTCLVSLKDHIPLFRGARLANDMIWWSPPYAYPPFLPRPFDPEKEGWDILFVGTVNKNINPERCAFFEELGALLPELHVTGGSPYELYPQAKIVLNHAIHGDLNFRVFEALGSGSCLVTPSVRHGLSELFTHGVDLFTYDQSDLPGLARLCRALLKTPERCKTVAASGHANVLEKHYIHHRAERFAANIVALTGSGKAGEMVATRLREAPSIHSQWLKLLYLLHAETAANEQIGAAYLAAARR